MSPWQAYPYIFRKRVTCPERKSNTHTGDASLHHTESKGGLSVAWDHTHKRRPSKTHENATEALERLQQQWLLIMVGGGPPLRAFRVVSEQDSVWSGVGLGVSHMPFMVLLCVASCPAHWAGCHSVQS